MTTDAIVHELNMLLKSPDGDYYISHDLITKIIEALHFYEEKCDSSSERLQLILEKVNVLIDLKDIESTEDKNVQELRQILRLIGIKKRIEMLLIDFKG